MTVLSAENVRTQLRSIWPDIEFIWLVDNQYLLAPIAEIMEAVTAAGVHKLRFDGEVCDCDDYALQLNAAIKKHAITHNFTSHWAFGEAFGTRFDRDDEIHTANIAIATEGIYIIEPQLCQHWKASAQNDTLLIVKM